SEAKDLKWPKNEILRYTQNDKKREKCFFTQPDVPELSPFLFQKPPFFYVIKNKIYRTFFAIEVTAQCRYLTRCPSNI
ncbi:MAG: hypothetical protein GX925_01875, partial [Clostridiales bacterium]|nr:hypothetical protein [Clostridiales bacterium]